MGKNKDKCKRFREMLSPYIDGQLGASEAERVERHVAACDACREELESLRAVVGLLGRVREVAPQRSFTVPATAVRRRPLLLNGLRVATAVAALCLALVLVGDVVGFPGTAPTKQTLGGEEYVATPAATPTRGGTPVPGATLNGDDSLAATEEWGLGDEALGDSEYSWPVRSVEIALTGAVVVLGGATATLWIRQRRRDVVEVRSTTRQKGGRR